MISFTEHIPSWAFNGQEPKKYKVDSYEELLKMNYYALDEYEYKPKDCQVVFATDEYGDKLMISSTNQKWWWVLGYVIGIDLSKYLPHYQDVYKEELLWNDM